MCNKDLNSKKFRGLDLDGMPLKEQWRLSADIRKFKYQVKVQHRNGRVRFIHTNEEEAVKEYVRVTRCKIIWIRET